MGDKCHKCKEKIKDDYHKYFMPTLKGLEVTCEKCWHKTKFRKVTICACGRKVPRRTGGKKCYYCAQEQPTELIKNGI